MAATGIAPAHADDSDGAGDEIVLRGTLYEAGDYELGGRVPACGRTRTILTADLGDYGASIGAFIVLNPVRLDRLSAATRLFVYTHECSHQLYGPGEARADCYAAKRGKAEGWLRPADIEQVCRIFPHKSKSPDHADRTDRCAAIKACYAGSTAPKSSPIQVSGSGSGSGNTQRTMR
ncbi:hypothetical protein [Microbaculum sp. FT89]|uniref:hypothetical protein n=1 Tax=Microbaculum sp. FT89 TaxID=3447298 RepID=UPI003F52DBBE